MKSHPAKHEYDAWLHWSLTTKCNLRCTYCFLGDESQKPHTSFNFKTHIKTALKCDRRSTGRLAPICIKDLIETLDRTDKIFRISFTGGEPFLVPNITEACAAITKKHYISFNTNLTLPQVKIFADTIDPERVLFIVASLHLKELDNKHMKNMFISNFKYMKKMGFHIFAREVAYPKLLSEIDSYRSIYKKSGITFQFEPFHGWYENRHYPEGYTKDMLKKFGLSSRDILVFNNWKGKKCIAGFSAGVVHPEGNITRCFTLNDPMGSVYDNIAMYSTCHTCPVDYCSCPLNIYDTYLASKI